MQVTFQPQAIRFSLWFEGYFEKIVMNVKLCRKMALHRAMVTKDELHTAICVINTYFNGRTQTSITGSIDDYQPQALSQLMLEYRLDGIPVSTLDQ